jgi:hypothetical protein
VTESDDGREVSKEFEDVVNVAPKELEEWLATDESKEVGWPKDGWRYSLMNGVTTR